MDGGGSTDGGELKDVLNFANWPFYIDVDKPTTLQDFTKQTGIKVNYFEEINDNAEYFAKVQGPLSQGDGIDRDIFVFTDNSRFPGILVNEGWVQKLDKEPHPEHRRTSSTRRRARPSTRTASTRCRGSRA